MKVKLLNLWESIRTSFWFIPGLLVIAACGLSWMTLSLDRHTGTEPGGIYGLLYVSGPDGARGILSTIAGSMITVAGTAFSITIVALTLASTQFGPRLLRNFMKDTGNQVVLGLFLATFVYCILVLRTVGSTGNEMFVPNISVTVAITAAIVNVGVLIYFIHHVSTSIQADHIITGVYEELIEGIEHLFPEAMGNEDVAQQDAEETWQAEQGKYTEEMEITAVTSGYIQAIDSEGIIALAREQDLLFAIARWPGEFVVRNGVLARLKSHGRVDAGIREKAADLFILGTHRTPEQDVEYAIHQLVEVAVRALSPGINDPQTANLCIDRLCSVLCALCSRQLPAPCRYDDEGTLRAVTKTMTFADVLNAAFDQIRQYGRSSVAVTLHLLESLRQLAEYTEDAAHRSAIRRQADMIESDARDSGFNENDRAIIHRHHRALVNLAS